MGLCMLQEVTDRQRHKLSEHKEGHDFKNDGVCIGPEEIEGIMC